MKGSVSFLTVQSTDEKKNNHFFQTLDIELKKKRRKLKSLDLIMLKGEVLTLTIYLTMEKQKIS